MGSSQSEDDCLQASQPEPLTGSDEALLDEEYYARVREYTLTRAWMLSHNPSYVEDAVQDVMARLIVQEAREARPDNIEAWVNVVLRNRIFDKGRYWRRRQQRELYGSIDDTAVAERLQPLYRNPSPDTQGMQGALVADIVSSLREILSIRELEIVSLAFHGLSNEAIADRMDYANAQTVKVLRSRIRAKVRDGLGGNLAPEWLGGF